MIPSRRDGERRAGLMLRPEKSAAEGQRATSTNQLEREFAWVMARAELCGEGLRLYGMTNSARIEEIRRRVDVSMPQKDQTATLEVPNERVEEFAAAARQIIDARLQAHADECPDYWQIVAGLYAPEPEEEPPADANDRR